MPSADTCSAFVNIYRLSGDCAQRLSPNPVYYAECVNGLSHRDSGGTIFYSLVPDSILTQSH